MCSVSLFTGGLGMKGIVLGGAVALTIVMCPGSSFDKDHEDRLDTPTYKKCMDEANGITAEMHGCLADELERQDKLLNDTYKVVLDSMVKDALIRQKRTVWPTRERGTGR
jgi:uncharacterized protein YecT (DUF1311 family)